MIQGLVSVITPCYNSGTFIHRLLDSVLSQDYPRIAMLVVDDGSTDNSREVIESYISRFAVRGYSLEYRYQDNAGQSVAINNALKWVKGEFLVWPDSDDWYLSPHAISCMVESCASSPKVGMARLLYSTYDATGSLINKMSIAPDFSDKDQFESCLFRFGGLFAAGACIVPMKAFDESIPNREIYTEKIAGQNWQLMLPVLYQRECITIPKYMYAILARHDSHCRGQNTYEKSSAVLYGYIHQLHFTLDHIAAIPSERRDGYKRKVEKQYLVEIFIQAVVYGKKTEAKNVLDRLNSLGGAAIDRQWLFRYRFCQYTWFRGLIKLLGKIR